MSKKIPVITTPEYIVYLERFDDNIWVHSDVFRWTPRVKEQYKEYLDFVLDSLKRTVYAVNEPEGYAKRHKFMLLVGFEFHCSRDFGNGAVRDVYRRDSKWVH